MHKPAKLQAQSALVEMIVIDGCLDAHSLETLKLEVRRLASSCGLEIREIEVVPEARRSGRQR
jgi:hypothetical protein